MYLFGITLRFWDFFGVATIDVYLQASCGSSKGNGFHIIYLSLLFFNISITCGRVLIEIFGGFVDGLSISRVKIDNPTLLVCSYIFQLSFSSPSFFNWYYVSCIICNTQDTNDKYVETSFAITASNNKYFYIWTRWKVH